MLTSFMKVLEMASVFFRNAVRERQCPYSSDDTVEAEITKSGDDEIPPLTGCCGGCGQEDEGGAHQDGAHSEGR